jgi:phosphate transport system permease protein
MTTLPAPAVLAGARVGVLRRVKNNLATVLVCASLLVALVPLVWLLASVLSKGWTAISSSGWFTASQRNKLYTDPGGGAKHAIIGTFEQVALCTAVSVPIGLLVAVYLVEYGRGPLARVTTFMVDILTGLPSIVAAVFIYSVFIIVLGGQKAGWLVSAALVMLMIPVIVRTTEQMLRLVPNELREAAYALGVPKWKTVIRVVLPTALSGIITGIVLGIARVAGETAPLLVLALYTPNSNTDPFTGPQASLPTMINDNFAYYSTQGTFQLGPNGKPVQVHNYAIDRVWGAALTLVAIVLLLNLIARFLGRFNKLAK